MEAGLLTPPPSAGPAEGPESSLPPAASLDGEGWALGRVLRALYFA